MIRYKYFKYSIITKTKSLTGDKVLLGHLCKGKGPWLGIGNGMNELIKSPIKILRFVNSVINDNDGLLVVSEETEDFLLSTIASLGFKLCKDPLK